MKKHAHPLRHWWLKAGFIVIAALLVAILADRYDCLGWLESKLAARPRIALMGPEEHELNDEWTGLRFTFPKDYSTLAQSRPVPGDTGDQERVIIKCKRDWDGTANGKMPAWLYISVKNEPANSSLGELAREKRPEVGVHREDDDDDKDQDKDKDKEKEQAKDREKEQDKDKDKEDEKAQTIKEFDIENLEIDGNPAARARFEFRYHHNDFVREVVMVRKGARVFCVLFEFLKEDKTTVRDEMHDAIASMRLSK
jgi:hypothetical protein